MASGDLSARLTDVLARYDWLTEQMSQPDVVDDLGRLQELARGVGGFPAPRVDLLRHTTVSVSALLLPPGTVPARARPGRSAAGTSPASRRYIEPTQ